MHRHLPPIFPQGPHAPHALDCIPIAIRPEWAERQCASCEGRGSWNDIFHPDSFRCRRAQCSQCHGAGWVRTDGMRQVPTIKMIEGHAAWATEVVRPAPHLVCLSEAEFRAPEDLLEAA